MNLRDALGPETVGVYAAGFAVIALEAAIRIKGYRIWFTFWTVFYTWSAFVGLIVRV